MCVKLYSYIVAHDTGFAPNPYWGFCTLACCKPAIRRTACMGDWIVGLSSKSRCHKIIYAMEITEEPIGFAKYYCDPRFENKKPKMESLNYKMRVGDNIYEDDHSDPLNSLHKIEDKKTDLSGLKVLLSNSFYYFGVNIIRLPSEYDYLKVGRGHKCHTNPEQINKFVSWLQDYWKQGIYGQPCDMH